MRFPLTTVQADAERVEGERACGPCTACCVLPRIAAEPDFPNGKPGYTPCSKLCANGCSIYDDRPELCRSYKCLWRAGIIDGDERRRPDRLGLMFTLGGEDYNFIIEVWELWDRAASENPGRYIIDAIAKRYPVAIRFYGVPASISYVEPKVMVIGTRLSDASLNHPRELAEWCDMKTQLGELVDTSDDPSSHLHDLASLRRGEPVRRHFRPNR